MSSSARPGRSRGPGSAAGRPPREARVARDRAPTAPVDAASRRVRRGARSGPIAHACRCWRLGSRSRSSPASIRSCRLAPPDSPRSMQARSPEVTRRLRVRRGAPTAMSPISRVRGRGSGPPLDLPISPRNVRTATSSAARRGRPQQDHSLGVGEWRNAGESARRGGAGNAHRDRLRRLSYRTQGGERQHLATYRRAVRLLSPDRFRRF